MGADKPRPLEIRVQYCSREQIDRNRSMQVPCSRRTGQWPSVAPTFNFTMIGGRNEPREAGPASGISAVPWNARKAKYSK
jgi:hypothetical protein